MKYLLTVISFFIYLILAAQGSQKKSDLILIFNFEYKQLYQNTLMNVSKRVDPVVDKDRLHDSLPYYSPFSHNAVFAAPSIGLKYKNRYKIIFSEFIEQRGWSYGWNIRYFNTVYPKIQLTARDTFNIHGNEITYFLDYGDFYTRDEIDFGLRAYNLNVQGLHGVIRVGSYGLYFLNIVDLAETVGLNIKRYNRFKMEKTFYSGQNKNITASLSFDKYKVLKNRMNNVMDDRYSFGLSARYFLKNKMDIVIIGDYLTKANHDKGIPVQNFAIFFKSNFYIKSKNSKWIVSSAVRYYGHNYIKENYEASYSTWNYRYHQRIYYPLEAYYNPVSQFAFYTEYHNVSDLFGEEFEMKWDYHIYKKLSQSINIEFFNIYRATSNYGNNFSYFFYSYYLYLKFLHNLNLGIFISNKQYNQDVQYMTFYQMNIPYFGFHISYTGNFTKEIFSHEQQ